MLDLRQSNLQAMPTHLIQKKRYQRPSSQRFNSSMHSVTTVCCVYVGNGAHCLGSGASRLSGNVRSGVAHQGSVTTYSVLVSQITGLDNWHPLHMVVWCPVAYPQDAGESLAMTYNWYYVNQSLVVYAWPLAWCMYGHGGYMYADGGGVCPTSTGVIGSHKVLYMYTL